MLECILCSSSFCAFAAETSAASSGAASSSMSSARRKRTRSASLAQAVPAYAASGASRHTEWRRARSQSASRGGWLPSGGGDGAFAELVNGLPSTDAKQVIAWESFAAAEQSSWRTPAIEPVNAQLVSQLKLSSVVNAYTVGGNIIRRSKAQLDLLMFDDPDWQMHDIEDLAVRHPIVKEGLLVNTGKLEGDGINGDHQSCWNIQFSMWGGIPGKITLGYTKHKCGNRDASGQQRTHIWATFCQRCTDEHLQRLCDLMLNLGRYRCHFSSVHPHLGLPVSSQPSSSSGQLVAPSPASSAPQNPSAYEQPPPPTHPPSATSSAPQHPSADEQPPPPTGHPPGWYDGNHTHSFHHQPPLGDGDEALQLAIATRNDDVEELDMSTQELPFSIIPQTTGNSTAVPQPSGTDLAYYFARQSSQRQHDGGSSAGRVQEEWSWPPPDQQRSSHAAYEGWSASEDPWRAAATSSRQAQPCGDLWTVSMGASDARGQPVASGGQAPVDTSSSWMGWPQDAADHHHGWPRRVSWWVAPDASGQLVASGWQAPVENKSPSSSPSWLPQDGYAAHTASHLWSDCLVEEFNNTAESDGPPVAPMRPHRRSSSRDALARNGPRVASRRNKGASSSRIPGLRTQWQSRYDPTADVSIGNLPDWWKPTLVTQAKQSATSAMFPADAKSMASLGPYAQKFAPILYDSCRHRRPDLGAEPRDFVSRTTHDSVILKKTMKGLLEWSEPEIMEKTEQLDPEQRAFLQLKRSALFRCCSLDRPDPAHSGFRPLSTYEFETRHGNCLSTYIGHLCESCTGEAIAVHSEDDRMHEEPNPRVVAMHHPQFFVNAHKNNDDWHARESATAFMNSNTKTAAGEACFLDTQRTCENSVYKPTESGESCWSVCVHFHTLPSLIWECCEYANLLDIYSYFRNQPLFVTKAAHPKAGHGSRVRNAANRRHLPLPCGGSERLAQHAYN